MLGIRIFCLTMVLLTCLCAIAFGYTPAEIQREIIVMFKPGVINLPESTTVVSLDSVVISSPDVRTALARFNPELIVRGFPGHNPADSVAISETGQVIKKLDLSPIFKIRLAERASRDSLIEVLSTAPEVIYAERNGITEFASPVFPNDQYFHLQWGLYNTGQFGGTNRADIHAPEAWEIFKGSSSIKIGIIDSGVDGSHPDLNGKVSGDVGYYDDHGTHVAGIAAAKTDNNNTGIAGGDWYAQIISQRNDGADATGNYNAVMDAVNAGAYVLNNSWFWPEGYSTTIRAAFAYAYKMNRIATAAMCNDWGEVIRYPAAFGQGIIAVGATNDRDQRSAYSNIGNHIDVSAPGDNIYSTVPVSYGSYDYMYGTSMATPFVTGLVSLLKGYKSVLSNDDIEQLIRISADRIRPDLYPYDENGWNINVGCGRINARKAFDLLRHPNYFAQASASGAFRAGNTGIYSTVFFDTPGLAPGVYFVKRYEARKI